MSISYNDAIFHLKKLQKRLFYSESNSQSIYTCFNDKSKKFLDVEALQKFNNEICQKLLNGEQVTIKQKDNPHEYENIYALIKSIFASNEAIKKEQSRDSLFLAYPYIIGTSNKHSNLVQSIFRAPFLL
jgi:predicted choloylglycine hydrolase